MADTMSFALLGALIFTLTFVPVIASYWFKSGVKEKQNRVYNWVRDRYASRLVWCLDHPKVTVIGALLIFGAHAAADTADRRRIFAASG